MSAPDLVEHFFRHEYGRLVAVLSCRVGIQHIETVEDAVQSALMKAMEVWATKGLPENPSGWLFRVAQNTLLDDLRQRTNRSRLLGNYAHEIDQLQNTPQYLMPREVQDDLLRMLFASCDDAIAPDAQLVLALKTLCGFSTGEIALRLFTSEATIYKRLGRARRRLRKNPLKLGELTSVQHVERRPSVLKVLYLLFTEGYLSSHAQLAIRRELCDEAIRLTTLLAAHPVGQEPETFALLALMHLHMARMSSRQNGSGGLILLEEQDRTLWQQERIEIGLSWLARSARGDGFSRYHAEAGIAAEHCLAPSFEQTRWDRVVSCYELLESVSRSPIHTMNRAVAVAEWQDAASGIAVMESIETPLWLAVSYQWKAVLSDLHRRNNDLEKAGEYRDEALKLAPSEAVKTLLERRLQMPVSD